MSDMQYWKPHDFRETLYSEAFGVADYEFAMGFLEFNYFDYCCQRNLKKNLTIIVIHFFVVIHNILEWKKKIVRVTAWSKRPGTPHILYIINIIL